MLRDTVVMDFRRYDKFLLESRFTLAVDNDMLSQLLALSLYDAPADQKFHTHGMAYVNCWEDGKSRTILGNRNDVDTFVEIARTSDHNILFVTCTDVHSGMRMKFSLCIPANSKHNEKFTEMIKFLKDRLK